MCLGAAVGAAAGTGSGSESGAELACYLRPYDAVGHDRLWPSFSPLQGQADGRQQPSAMSGAVRSRTRKVGFVISAIDRHDIACRHPECRCICLNVAQGVRVRCPYHVLAVRHCRPSLGADSILTYDTPALFPNVTDPLWSGLSHIRRTNFVLVSFSIPDSTMCLERYFRLPVFDFLGIHVMTVTGK